MWASHVHDLSLWADLVASERAAECELLYLKSTGMPDRPWAQRQQRGHSSNVPFGHALSMFGAYIDRTDTPHRWPTHARPLKAHVFPLERGG